MRLTGTLLRVVSRARSPLATGHPAGQSDSVEVGEIGQRLQNVGARPHHSVPQIPNRVTTGAEDADRQNQNNPLI